MKGAKVKGIKVNFLLDSSLYFFVILSFHPKKWQTLFTHLQINFQN